MGFATDREPTERDSLLPNSKGQWKSSLRRAGRRWVIPFWFLASFSRGMTLAPRVEVFTTLACHAYFPDQAQTFDSLHDPIRFTQEAWLPARLQRYNAERRKSQASKDQPAEHLSGKEESGEIGPQPLDDRCFSHAGVQELSAQLQMAVILTMGVLSAMTTGFWGSLGDKVGRTKIMATSLVGYLTTDLVFLLVAYYAKLLVPWGGHWMLVAGPVVEGLLGGWTTTTAAVNAYVSDVTMHGSRSKTFSSFQGLLYAGVATGPAFASILMTYKPNILLIFVISVSVSIVNCLFAVFVVPESLTKEVRAAARARRESTSGCRTRADGAGMIESLTSRVALLFRSLRVFAPRGNDWRLMYLAVGYAMVQLTVGSYPLKLLYAQHMFEWGAVELGTFLTFVGTARALFLLIGLPTAIKIFKPKNAKPPVSKTPSPDATAATTTTGASNSSASVASAPAQVDDTIAKELEFDIKLSRISLLLDAIGNISITWTTGPQGLVGGTFISALGGGAWPAIQSACLCLLPNPRENSGKMFGALSMIQSICATIISPLVFGLLYSSTVATYPTAFFVFGCALLTTGFTSLLLVRPVKAGQPRGRSDGKKRLKSTDVDYDSA